MGVEPMGALGSSDVRMVSITFGGFCFVSMTLTELDPAHATNNRPSFRQSRSAGCEATFTRDVSFIVAGSSRLTLAPPQFAIASDFTSLDSVTLHGRYPTFAVAITVPSALR